MSAVTLAADWAESLGAVAATAGVLATLFVGWVGWRAAVPHRKIAYSIEFTPLLSSTHGGLTVHLGGAQIAQPQTATLKIVNGGNREIQPADYNGEPIEFRLGARIVSVLTTSTTGSRRVPPAAIHGQSLHIDPYVIHKRQAITYKLLLDGTDPVLSLRHSVSGQVKEDTSRRKLSWAVSMFLLATLAVGLGAMYAIHFGRVPTDEVKRIQQRAYDQGVHDAQRAAQQQGKSDSPDSSAPTAAPSPSPS